MNYQDLVDPNNPKSWQNTMGDNKKASPSKRFSMNFMDTLGEQDPRSWQNTVTATAKVYQKQLEKCSRATESKISFGKCRLWL